MNAKQRRQNDDQIMRRLIGQQMRWQHAKRYDNKPYQVLAEGKRMAAEQCARHLADGELGLAHAAARVHAYLLASSERLYARHAAARLVEKINAAEAQS
jgi:hypothetical protein